IAETTNEPVTEVVVPDPIDHDSHRQRMSGLSEPAREGQTPAGGFRTGPRRRDLECGLAIGQSGGHSGLNWRAGVQVVAAAIKIGCGRLSPIPECHDAWLGKPPGFE